MRKNVPSLKKTTEFLSSGLDLVEIIGLCIVGFATTWAIVQEAVGMVLAHQVTLADLLLLFLYLEVLAMVGQYFRTGQIQVRFPLYIAIVALARYLILDAKEISELRMLSITVAILLLTVAVLIIRFGHLRFPYGEKDDQ
jgi:protein PsiE